MQETPKGLRLQIGLFGRRNSGKSTLMNVLVGQAVSIVSAQPGTTTDPVEKPFELAPLGAVLFIDTAGLDDEGALGAQRVQRTRAVLERVDVALLVVGEAGWGAFEAAWLAELRQQGTPCLVVFNKVDLRAPAPEALAELASAGVPCVSVAAQAQQGLAAVQEALIRLAPEGALSDAQLIGDLVAPGEVVLLVVPIDLGAPKGRLILPQVQTLRDLLDRDALSLLVKERELGQALASLKAPPRLVVCDSQVVLKVAAETPPSIPLTTFSILMARFKGDMLRLAEGAGQIHRLRPGDRVLISESCAHHALADDIGRVKIPRWLRQFAGGGLEIEVCAGKDFPEDLSPYALVVQCGGCTVTRRQILARQYRAAQQGVPMTNYGMTISVVQGVLERTLGCFPAAQQAYRRALHAAGART